MILFLDDSPERAAIAYSRMVEKERSKVIWCMTAEEAIITVWDYRKVLEKVMLDHDLGGKTYVHTSRDDCGMEIVRFLENKARTEPEEFENLKKAQFIVHTWNEYAGPVMVERLKKLGLKTVHIPFGM